MRAWRRTAAQSPGRGSAIGDPLGGDDVAALERGGEERRRGEGLEVGQGVSGQTPPDGVVVDEHPRERVTERPGVGPGGHAVGCARRPASLLVVTEQLGACFLGLGPVLLREHAGDAVSVDPHQHAESGHSAGECSGDHAPGARVEVAQHPGDVSRRPSGGSRRATFRSSPVHVRPVWVSASTRRRLVRLLRAGAAGETGRVWSSHAAARRQGPRLRAPRPGREPPSSCPTCGVTRCSCTSTRRPTRRAAPSRRAGSTTCSATSATPSSSGSARTSRRSSSSSPRSTASASSCSPTPTTHRRGVRRVEGKEHVRPQVHGHRAVGLPRRRAGQDRRGLVQGQPRRHAEEPARRAARDGACRSRPTSSRTARRSCSSTR